MFRGENATCKKSTEKWAGNRPGKIKELWQSYHVESRGKYRMKLRWIVRCVGVR